MQNLEAVENIPSYVSSMMGSPHPRGHANLIAIDRDAVLQTEQGPVSARMIFEQFEHQELLLYPAQRQALISVINPTSNLRYPIEMPFRVPAVDDCGQSMVEVYYGGKRFIAYSEALDTVGERRLVRYQEIPFDSSPPLNHIKPVAGALKSMIDNR